MLACAGFLLGCSGPSSAPVTPSDPLKILLTDRQGNTLQQVTINPAHLFCVYARLSHSIADSTALHFSWKSETDSAADSWQFCPAIPVGANGMGTILLTVTDPEGNQIIDSLPYLADTPPTMALDSGYFSPQNGSLQYADSSMGIPFTWRAVDPDSYDSLTYLVRLSSSAGSDSLLTDDSTGIWWPTPLAPLTQYTWQVVVIDRWGERDSSVLRFFTTRASWDRPRTVHGYVASKSPWTSPNSIRVLAITPNSDTLSFALDSLWGYTIQPGPGITTLRLCALLPSGPSPDTLTVMVSDSTSTLAPRALTL